MLDRLTCPDSCENGCPACILRPDMNMAQILPDRLAGAELARRLRELLALDPRRKVFGPDSHAASQSLFDLISQYVTKGIVGMKPLTKETSTNPATSSCRRAGITAESSTVGRRPVCPWLHCRPHSWEP